MKSFLPTAALIAGLVLLIGSAVSGMIFSPSNNWSEEKAQRMADLTTQAHGLLFKVNAASETPGMHGGANAAEVKAEYDKVKADLATLRDEFNGVRNAPLKAATILRWSGIAFVAASAFVMFATRA